MFVNFHRRGVNQKLDAVEQGRGNEQIW